MKYAYFKQRILLLLLLCFPGTEAFSTQTEASRGVLDLSGHSFQKVPKLLLDGEWRFFWNKLLLPKDSVSRGDYFRVPGYWSSYSVGGEKLPDRGFATFQLTLLLPPSQPPLLLTIPEQSTAWKLWIDDSLFVEKGSVTSSPQYASSGSGSSTIRIPPGTHHLITMQISNFTSARPGFAGSLLLGTEKAVNRYWGIRQGIDLFLIGCLTVLAIYHLFLFFNWRKEKAQLILSVLCFMWAVRFFVMGMSGRFILLIWPDTTVKLLWVLELIPLYTIAPLLLVFADNLFPGILNRKVIAGWWIISLICSGYAVMPFLGNANLLIEAANLLSIPAFYFITLNAVRRKLAGSVIITTGFTLFLLFAVNDILYDLHIINTEHLIDFGILSLGLSFSFHLSRHYAQTLVKIENLTIELEQRNRSSNPQSTKERLAGAGVKLLNMTLEFWERNNPGKSKANLARSSGLWKVYVNLDGWERTQTLDKYLDENSFPRHPRWKKVIATVEYVLANSNSSSSGYLELQEQLTILKEMV
jgi:hypothetical protein